MTRVSSKQTNKQTKCSVWTETNRNAICFGWFSVCFAKLMKHFFGLFRCFGSVSKQPKQTNLFRNKPKKRRKKTSLVYTVRSLKRSALYWKLTLNSRKWILNCVHWYFSNKQSVLRSRRPIIFWWSRSCKTMWKLDNISKISWYHDGHCHLTMMILKRYLTFMMLSVLAW
jgi:hypothetical protein